MTGENEFGLYPHRVKSGIDLFTPSVTLSKEERRIRKQAKKLPERPNGGIVKIVMPGDDGPERPNPVNGSQRRLIA